MFFARSAGLHGPSPPSQPARGRLLHRIFYAKRAKRRANVWPCQKIALPLHTLSEGSPCLTGNRRDGRVVDYSSLENYRTERYRGFESLSLRNSKRHRRRPHKQRPPLHQLQRRAFSLFAATRAVLHPETARFARQDGPSCTAKRATSPTRWLPGSWRQAASGCREGTARPRPSPTRPPRKAVRGRRTGGTGCAAKVKIN